MVNDLVSIIMRSHNNACFLKETVESVFAQTYQNWELLFLDDNSADDVVSQMVELKRNDSRIIVYKTVYTKGSTTIRNSLLEKAKGRWIAFLDVGDIWSPDKLEKQIAFMEKHGYGFTYTKYALINEKSEERGAIVGGKACVTYQDMMKCNWPAYMTVMCNIEKTGQISVRKLRKGNDYALWLNISMKTNCYLLNECLASQRSSRSILGKLLTTGKWTWRYKVYRIEEGYNPFVSSLYVVRNMWYGLLRWAKYVEK